jgi:hypothetical protein
VETIGRERGGASTVSSADPDQYRVGINLRVRQAIVFSSPTFLTHDTAKTRTADYIGQEGESKGPVVLKIILVVLVLVVAGVMTFIRLAPSEPAAWHVDPLTVPLPEMNGFLLRPEGGNAVSPVVAEDPVALLTRLDAVALAWPRTMRLAGSPEEGRITYVTRTWLMGYPDYTTVATVPVQGGVAVVVYGRQRFGSGDWGVNRARIDAWLAALGLPAT